MFTESLPIPRSPASPFGAPRGGPAGGRRLGWELRRLGSWAVAAMAGGAWGRPALRPVLVDHRAPRRPRR